MLVSNLPTLLAITVFTSGLVGCLLLLSWLQHRRIFALALWGSAFIIAAVATVLIVVARDTVPDFWSIVIGNAILAAAYGLIWSGARNFEGKRVSVVLTLAGTLVWLAACSIGPIRHSMKVTDVQISKRKRRLRFLSLARPPFLCCRSDGMIAITPKLPRQPVLF